jgi:hypothetical protein
LPCLLPFATRDNAEIHPLRVLEHWLVGAGLLVHLISLVALPLGVHVYSLAHRAHDEPLQPLVDYRMLPSFLKELPPLVICYLEIILHDLLKFLKLRLHIAFLEYLKGIMEIKILINFLLVLSILYG